MKSKIFNFDRYSESQWLTVTLLLALSFRVTTVIAIDIQPVSDYAAYDQMAMNFLSGKGLIEANGNVAFMSAGYSLFILAPIFGICGHSLLAAQLANAVLGTVSTWLVYLLARECGAGTLGRILATIFFALYLPSWIYAEYLAKENLMTPLMLGLVLYSIKMYANPSLRSAAIVGAVIGVLAITGNAALAMVPVTVFSVMSAVQSTPKKVFQVLLIGVVALAVVTPWVVRNQSAVDSPVLNTNGGFNLYLGNNPSANGMFVSIADTPRGPTWFQLRAEGEVAATATLKAEAIAWIKENPAEFLRLAIKKAGLFWMPPVHDGKGPQSKLETITRQVWLTQYVLICMAALASLAVPSLRNTRTFLVWGSVLAYTAIHMIFYIIFRYREPAMPLVIVLAALTSEHFVVVRKKNWRGSTSI